MPNKSIAPIADYDVSTSAGGRAYQGEPVAVMYADGSVLTRADCGASFETCCKVETPLYAKQPAATIARLMEAVHSIAGFPGVTGTQLRQLAERLNGKPAPAGIIPPLDLSELGLALHDAAKWESLYRNEHSTCTRLLDTMTGFRKERDALQKRLTGPVAIAMPDLEEEFPTWWENHGQYIRAGGGQYEISFAYGAYRDALAKVAEMNTTAGPDEAKP